MSMSAQPLPPSRTGSVGPPSAGGIHAATATTPGGSQQNSQQNLNQIVLEYLAKKGYSRTESMLRRESTHVDAQGQPIHVRLEDTGGRMYGVAFSLIQDWIDNVLDIYKPELKRILWPLFVYSFLQIVGDFYPRDGRDFFEAYRMPFDAEHQDDLRALSTVFDPEHLQEHDLAQLYRNNKYRLTLSAMAYATLVQFLEAKEHDGGRIILSLITQFLDVHVVDRSHLGGTRGLKQLLLLAERNGDSDVPAEDEGIPGHNPGSANRDQNASRTLQALSLGPMLLEADLMEDVKAELTQEDIAHPPAVGQISLSDQFELDIKQEEIDGLPVSRSARDTIPYPPSTSRDVAMEVQRVRENRDRFRIEGREGGVGAGVSVTMFTFHNTFDSVNCIEFSGDNALVAIGTAESYIRVWSLDNAALTSPIDPTSYQPSSSRRLIGHSGPVYAASFSPSLATSSPRVDLHTPASSSSTSSSYPRYLLSSSADATIRLWCLSTWTTLVIYRGHSSPVWDVRFSPHGHYFASASADRSARLWATPHIAPLRLFAHHDADVETLAWHPNGAYLFTGSCSGDKTVRMHSLLTGTEVRIFTGHVGNVTALACAPSGTLLASADDRGEILLWDLRTGRLAKRLRGHARGGVWSLGWSVESSALVSGGADGTVRVWDAMQVSSEGSGLTGARGAGESGVAGVKAGDASSTAGGVPAGGGPGVTNGGSTTTTTTTGPQGKVKAKGGAAVVSPEQISAFPTKKSPVYTVRFTQMNLVVAGGAYLP